MSAPLSKALRLEHKVRSLPVRQGDTVQVRSGEKKGEEGVIKSVYRKKFVIYVDRLTRDSCRGTQVQVGVHPSKVEITKIKMDSDRKAVCVTRSAPSAPARQPLLLSRPFSLPSPLLCVAGSRRAARPRRASSRSTLAPWTLTACPCTRSATLSRRERLREQPCRAGRGAPCAPRHTLATLFRVFTAQPPIILPPL